VDFVVVEAARDDLDALDLPRLDRAALAPLLDPADLEERPAADERADDAERADLPRAVDFVALPADFFVLADFMLLADFVLLPALAFARLPAPARLAVGLRICPSLACLRAPGAPGVAATTSLAVQRCRPDLVRPATVLALRNQRASVAGGGPKSSPRRRCAEVNYKKMRKHFGYHR
jgi:hypothetical protein